MAYFVLCFFLKKMYSMTLFTLSGESLFQNMENRLLYFANFVL